MKISKNAVLRPLIVALACAALSAPAANAGVMVTDLGGGNTMVTIDPITIDITSSGTTGFLVFEDFWAVDTTSGGSPVSSTMSYSLNSGAPIVPEQYSQTGRVDSVYGTIDLNDMFFDYQDGSDSVTAGDTFVIGGSFVFSGNVDGIATNPGPFVVSVLSTGGDIVRGSTTVALAVPAPAMISIFCLALAGLGIAARRRRAA